ncbi:hypothetical protein SK128_005352 [Halocaridina rubra]|uniref:Uncharacterized protein n=1 Tax=Halocaridina rubra TaxID=373956 RepID=A0AAN9A652_HALRR
MGGLHISLNFLKSLGNVFDHLIYWRLGFKTRTGNGLDYDDDYSHKESLKGRDTKDSRDEDILLAALKSFNLFSDEACDDLQYIAIKEIENYLLGEVEQLHSREVHCSRTKTGQVPRSSTQKEADLVQVLISEIQCPPSIGTADLGETAMLIIDGQAMAYFIGKPPKAATFGDLADVFTGAVLQGGMLFKQTDVVFDRNYEKSIKKVNKDMTWSSISGDLTFD